jgi:peptidoglycan/LPS O-acetylase OafA/YrhL
MKPAPLPTLTGLRFVAAAAVALSHLWYVAEHPALPSFVRRLLAEGSAGVTFFFVLSGFILTINYRPRFQVLTWDRLWPYAAARVGRIWPAHGVVLGWVVLFPYLPTDRPIDLTKLLTHVCLVQGWVPDLRYAAAFNAVAWTLSAEVFFYLLLPGGLWLANRFPHTSPTQWVILAGGVWLLELGCVSLFIGQTDPVSVWLVGICPAARLFEFTVGVLLGLAFLQRQSHAEPPASHHPGPSEPRLGSRATCWELLAVAGILLLASLAPRVPPLLKANGYYTAIMAGSVWIFAQQRGGVSRLLASGPMVVLGEISFAFYLLHCLIFFHMHRIVGVERLTSAGLAGASVAVTLLASAMIYHWIETPARRSIARLAARTAGQRNVSPWRFSIRIRGRALP